MAVSACDDVDGLSVRLARIVADERPVIIAALDAPVFQGPTGRLSESAELVADLIDGGIDGILAFPGFHSRFVPPEARIGRIVNITASSLLDRPTNKVAIAGPDLVQHLGGDAAGVHLNLGDRTGVDALRLAGRLVSECRLARIPSLVAAYTPDRDFNSEPDAAIHAARAAADLGAAVVKVPPLAELAAMSRLVDVLAPTPVVIAGGPVASEDEAIHIAERARKSRAAGLCFGRAFFENPSPRSLVKKLRVQLEAQQP